MQLSIQSPVWLLTLKYNSCVISDFNTPTLRTVRTFQAPILYPIFLPLKLHGICLLIRGLSWGFETIYVLRDWVSALRRISSNDEAPEGCYFFLYFLYANRTVAPGTVSICSTVCIALWIMTHSRSAAITQRSMLQYIESVYTYSDTE